MTLSTPKNLGILFVVVILVYALLVFVYPLFWATLFSKTNAPDKIGTQLLNKNSDLTNPKTLKVAVIGDSTAAGQGTDSVLQSFSYQYLQKINTSDLQIEYTNLAVSGSRIDQVLANQIPQIDTSSQLIFVAIGANDVTAFFSETEFTAKLELLAQKLKSIPAKVVWLSIPDFVTVPILLPPLNYFLSSTAKNFNAKIQEVATQNSFIYVDVFDSTRDEFRNHPDQTFSKDKYHPSSYGYSLWAQQIAKTYKF